MREKVWMIRDALQASLVERDDAIECLMTAFVCQEHVVFEGPPGTAKSLAADALMRCVSGGNYVRRLFHKFCTADELIGPMDLAHFKLKNAFRRVLKGGACDATGLFADEIFKANAAVLNTMLTLLEERQYADQSGTLELPLRMCVAASNEFPQEDILAALYDRFLFRDRVHYITARGAKRDLLKSKASAAKAAQGFTPPCTITIEEWDAIAADVDKVTVPDVLIDKYLDFCDLLAKDGIVLSDRRSVKVMRAIKAAAWLDDDATASVDHLHVLRFCAWDTPEEQERVIAAVKTLDRSTTREVLDNIDNALRAFRAMPTDLAGRREALGEVLTLITEAGKDAVDKRKKGSFSKRAEAKIERRMVELNAAYTEIERAIRPM